MTARRSRGEGGMFWDAARQRWIASVTVGYTPAGKRIYRRASGRTKTEARIKLQQLVRERDEGQTTSQDGYTVADAVRDWLDHGLGGRDRVTVETRRILAHRHVIPALGARKLVELSAEDVDRWLATKGRSLSTRTIQDLKSILRRAVTRAQARDKVARNVVLLCETPTGQTGRPSKALTLQQAHALVEHARGSTMGAYVLVSLLTGARTEELRALTWSHVDLTGSPHTDPPIPAHIRVWRSVRATGDTKTRASPPDPRATRTLRRSAQRAIPAARRPASARRLPLARCRSRLRLRSRHPTRCCQRPARVPPHRHRGRSRRRPMDAARAAAQLRVAVVRQGSAARADRPPRRAHRRVDSHRDRLPQATAPGHQRRRRGNERAVPPRR
jgi:integrase